MIVNIPTILPKMRPSSTPSESLGVEAAGGAGATGLSGDGTKLMKVVGPVAMLSEMAWRLLLKAAKKGLQKVLFRAWPRD
jgi:hypothetical protein